METPLSVCENDEVLIVVSEGLNSVETLVFLHHLGTLYEVSEGLNSVETNYYPGHP